MKRIFIVFSILTAIIILGTSSTKSVENSGTPPTGRTGATGSYCNACHGGNTLNAAGGGVAASGLPTSYSFGTGYSFSVTINHSAVDRKKWGFALKAVNANGVDIGTFTTTNTNTSVGSGEIRHSNAPSTSAGANTYTFNNLKWTAPATNTLANKSVKFYLVALAADGTGGTGGDFVYSNLSTVPLAIATTITSFTPKKAVIGTTVNIKGQGFTGATAVSFGGIAATSFTASTDSTISAVVGSGASGNVSVTSPSGNATLPGFTFCAVNPVSQNINLSGCNSVVYGDSTYFSSTIKKDTLRTTGGCDSIYKTTNISINPISPTAQSSNPSVCDKFIYKNVTYTTSTTIKDTLKSIKGCDSVFLIINATVNPSISGRIYHLTKGLIANVRMSQTGTTTNSFNVSNGLYNASCIAANNNVTLKPSKNNDVSKANGVNSIDALLVQRHILNISKLNSAYKLIAADVNGDKNINSVDILRMKRLILGSDTTFTGNRLWAFVDSAYAFPDTTNPFPYKDSMSFSNLTSSKTNQSFIGVKLGDVNYDWNPAVARGTTINSLELIVNTEKLKVNNDGTINIQLQTSNFNNLATMQYTLHFDNTKYEFVGIENNKIKIDINATQANEDGNIAMLWIDAKGETLSIEDGTSLFELVLKPKFTFYGLHLHDNEKLQSVNLSLTNDITNIEAWDKDLQQHNIVLKSIAKSQNQKLEEFVLTPNPSNGIVTLNFTSNKKQVIKVEISNSQGAIIYKQSNDLTKGTNSIVLNLKEKINLTPGVYFLKVIGLETEQIKKIIVN